MARLPQLLFLFALIVFTEGGHRNSLVLEQVLMLSRHNIRTPFNPLISHLDTYTPKQWPRFNASAAHLTEKGALLERYFAKYITKWLANEDFLKGCPEQEDILIYSNTKARTIDTAKAFINGAFPYCNVSLYHNENTSIFDPVFFPIFHNQTESFKQQMTREMERKLNEMDIKEAYSELNKILDIQNSEICKHGLLCDLYDIRNVVVLKDNEEPAISGRLGIGAQIVDSFLMAYFEGLPLEQVGWGELKTEEQWRLISKVIEKNQYVRFNFTTASKDIAEPLLDYMFNIFKTGNPKLSILFGHDSNMNSVMSALEFKPFKIKNQYEPYPIGGKVIFQKWSDGIHSYLKVEYVYQTALQLRNATKLSLEEPPERVVLELKGCETDERGFCSWAEFIEVHKSSKISNV